MCRSSTSGVSSICLFLLSHSILLVVSCLFVEENKFMQLWRDESLCFSETGMKLKLLFSG